ncbi:serine threonine- kinase Sgk2 protein [Rutstroemia sp. NJR-2017a BVV2]|nr:serine threonine- kinase Sgk2 protein [Rutstroemia sp. NJR-2017a BVV2]
MTVLLLTNIVAKNLVLDLILALQNEPAARILPSRNGYGTLLRDLSGHITLLDSNNFDIISSIPLVERVINNVPDVEIWNAVFDLVARTSTNDITPPTAFENAIFDTPLRSSSASQRGTEQTHDEVDQRILEELIGRVYYDVGGFYERYFEGKSWTNNTRDIYEESRAQYIESRWSG